MEASTVTTSASDILQDGPEARRIAMTIPYYPFHGVPRFYDISGMLADPEIFQLCVDVLARRYGGSDALLSIDCVAGVDARGFVLGAPLALALKKPFYMVRKAGKLPHAVSGQSYSKEYKGDDKNGQDSQCISRNGIKAGDRVLVIDDLVATGGTLIAACDLITSVGATVVECCCMVELRALAGFQKLQERHPTIKIWSLMTEDVLTLEGDAST